MTESFISIPSDQYNSKKEYLKLYNKNWVKKRRQQFMAEIGECYFCGTDQNIELHHIDPSEKESHKIFSWSDERIQDELKKCIPLCQECHIKFHRILKLKPLEHGTLYAYQRYGCRCELCRNANNEKNRGQRGIRSDPIIPCIEFNNDMESNQSRNGLTI